MQDHPSARKSEEEVKKDFRQTLGNFCSGIVVATAIHADAPVAFVAQSFFSLSLSPPLIGICPAKTSSSWPKIRDSGHFCINILAASQRDVCVTMASSGANGPNKFANVKWSQGGNGAPVIEGVLAYVECDWLAEHDAGDHTIAVGRAREVVTLEPDAKPLLYFQSGYGTFGDL